MTVPYRPSSIPGPTLTATPLPDPSLQFPPKGFLMNHHDTISNHGARARALRPVALLLAVLAALLVPFGAATASAAPALPADTGWVRFGHFAPSVADVDVFVDGNPFVSGIAFRSVSDYVPLPTGTHRFEVRASGSPDTLLSIEAGVPSAASLTIGAVSTRDGLSPQVYTDELVQPAPDAAVVRFIHAAPDVQAVDVSVVNGPVLAADVPYPAATGYTNIAPGTYDVEVTAAGTDDVVLRVKDWTIQPGVQASIVIVRGADGQIDVAPVEDAVAAAVAPQGGIQTGGGSMADVLDPITPNTTGNHVSVMVAVMMAALASAVGLGALVTRKRRTA